MPDHPPAPPLEFEPRIQEIGHELLDEARNRRGWWKRFTEQDILLERMMGNEGLRVAALRFVDVLPTLSDDEQLTRHLNEYFGDSHLPLPLPGFTRWGLHRAREGVAASLVARGVRGVADRMARRFIASDRIETARLALHRLHRRGMGFTLDLLGEAVVSEAEADQYQQQYFHLLAGLDPIVREWELSPRMDRLSGRRSPRLNLSIKTSSLYSQLDPAAPDAAVEAIKTRLRPIFHDARRRGAFITLDMEQYDKKDVTLRVFRELLSEAEFADWPDAGIAMQAYLRQTPGDLASLIEWARQRPAPVQVRLVRGAYWDYETIIARQHGWPVPVWTRKDQTDACYEHCLRMLMEAYPHVETAVATHNVRSLAVALALAERFDLKADQYEIQMLFGMADTLKAQLIHMGQRLRVYVSFGELIPGMAYLVRRLLENTDSQSFVRLGFTEDTPPEQLLAPPQPVRHETGTLPPPHPRRTPHAPTLPPFTNEPFHRFTDPQEREVFRAAIDRVRGQLGGHYPIVIAGESRSTDHAIMSVDPAAPERVVGTTASAGDREANIAVEAAIDAFESWRRTPVEQRADVLMNAAAMLRRRRDQFAAWEVFEAAKPWREADADVTEAIDFIEYYARQALRLSEGRAVSMPGEANALLYEPRGPGAIIPPWNFPLAIPTGMSIAAIAAGNSVVLKPAPQTPVIIAHFTALMHEAGLPPGVLNYLPGGDDAGKALVRHPDLHFIAFTGSQAAGCHIYADAAQVAEGQDHLKHVIAEMGGKNAIIVDSDADLDDAVLGTVGSAFSYAGQKCSACSRAIVVGDLYEPFLDRLIDAAASLRVGPAHEPGIAVPPVIDADAQSRIRASIESARSYADLALQVDTSHLGDGYYIGPTVFADVPYDSPLAQEEVFGPVLAVMHAADFDHAIRLANAGRYALTGGVYSRSPAHLDQARRNFRVGNLYLNRRITGALVSRQPFGGMKMSGTNAKAGGPDYLLHFLQSRCITENTLRRGFAPE